MLSGYGPIIRNSRSKVFYSRYYLLSSIRHSLLYCFWFQTANHTCYTPSFFRVYTSIRYLFITLSIFFFGSKQLIYLLYTHQVCSVFTQVIPFISANDPKFGFYPGEKKKKKNRVESSPRVESVIKPLPGYL